MELRDYQKDIVSEVFEKGDNVLIVLPTGGGKTVIAKDIISKIREQVIFIVPKLELIRQAASTFDEKCDIIWSNKTVVEKNHITVASKQTLIHRNLSKYFSEPVVVIVDEVHIGLQSLKKCLKGVNVKRIIGLTATPERNDGRSFVVKDKCKQKCKNNKIYEYAVFDRVINKWNIQALQKLGFLSPLKVTINPDAEKLSKIKPKHAYDDELDSEVIMDELGDSFFNFVKKAKEFAGKPTLVFTPDLQSLDVVLSTLIKSDLRYKGINGMMDVEERKVILNELQNGELDGVVNCGVLTTGFDMPCIKQCIIIRNIKSRVLFFQIVGRFIRPYNDETAEIYDFGGSCYNFATASNPDVFSNPVEWKYEGFEIKESDKERKERKKTEELMDSISEMNITWTEYLKNPVETLLNCLLVYKENFEINLQDSVVQETADIVKKAKLHVINAKNQMQNEIEIEKRKMRNEVEFEKKKAINNILQNKENILNYYALNPVKEWFANNSFDWFRRNFPLILKEFSYSSKDKMEYITGNVSKELEEKLEKIRLKTYKSLPFDNLPTEDAYLNDAYKQRTDWWFRNFQLMKVIDSVPQENTVKNTNVKSLASQALEA